MLKFYKQRSAVEFSRSRIEFDAFTAQFCFLRQGFFLRWLWYDGYKFALIVVNVRHQPRYRHLPAMLRSPCWHYHVSSHYSRNLLEQRLQNQFTIDDWVIWHLCFQHAGYDHPNSSGSKPLLFVHGFLSFIFSNHFL